MGYRNKRGVPIVCFGDSDWWYHNRGHLDFQLMRRYAETGRVLYINSIVVRKFNVQEGTMFLRRLQRKVRSILRGMRPSGVENMTVYSPFSMPVHHIIGARYLNRLALSLQVGHCMRTLSMAEPIVWVVCPGAAEVAIRLPHTKLVYQRSDRYEDFPGLDSKQIRLYDQLLKRHADLVIYVNRDMWIQERSDCRKAIFLDQGVDYELFAHAHRDQYVPEEMKRIPHPIVGIHSGIDVHKLDLSLVERLADILPEVSIVLIGGSSIDLSGLSSRKNVYVLGKKPYEQIPHYAKCFDVCFLPFPQNRWIAAANPIKLKECLALGKPIVSVPCSAVEAYKDIVYVASDVNAFAEAVTKACTENDPGLVAARRERVSGSTWEAKATEAMRALHEVTPASTEFPRVS